MAPRIQVTFDCWNVHMMCRWWADRLAYVVEDSHDLVQRLLDESKLTPADIMTVNGRLAFASAASAVDPGGLGPKLYFQAVPEAKITKNRIHLDIGLDGRELDDVVKEYVDAGATYSGPGHSWARMADPEGNEFCIH